MNRTEWKNYMKLIITGLNEADNSTDRRRYYNKAMEALEQAEFLNEYYDTFPEEHLYINRIREKKIFPSYYGNGEIIWMNGVQPIKEKDTQQCYLIEMYDEEGNFMYSKVGTTTRPTVQRMLEHLKYYQKENIGAIHVLRLYDCGAIDAEGFESLIRGRYIVDHPGTFKKNDRFINIRFDCEEIDKIVKENLRNDV